ncbi:MAG: methyltransferase domain-containing protein [Candidatus Fimisoma sp.]|nr:methyltransferase domain-containing protein [Candidatus Fimisoma sp.]
MWTLHLLVFRGRLHLVLPAYLGYNNDISRIIIQKAGIENMNKFERYRQTCSVLVCPVCGGGLGLTAAGRSLACSAGHSFDIARQGYVNLYRGKPVNEYSKESFRQRQQILEKGMYAHILEEICSFLQAVCGAGRPRLLLDAGCGEGYYTREIAARLGGCGLDFYGVDLSRDSVQLAASTANQAGGAASAIKWLVADIGHLPVRDGSVDFLLDIFTSAIYEEFQRILSPDGYLIKVIPGEGHVKELREAASSQLHHKDYKERKGTAVFSEHFETILNKTVSQTFAVTPEERDVFIHMTPLLFHVDKTKVDWSAVHSITVEGQLLIGRKK